MTLVGCNKYCFASKVLEDEHNWKGENLLLAIGVFHESIRFADHEYSVVLLDDKEVVFKGKVSPDAMQYFSFPVSETARWMRAEIFDETRKLRIALGNPSGTTPAIIELVVLITLCSSG